ncbi:hypothetical protein [Chryseobacterium sp. A301]
MKQNIDFQLIKIENPEFAILEPSYDDVKRIKVNTALRFSISDPHNMITCQVIIEYISHDSKKLLKLQTDNHFKVKPNDWAKFKTENMITLPKGFLAHLATISVGNTRGVLFSKSENTFYNRFLLPLINVVEMIPEDEIIEIKN